MWLFRYRNSKHKNFRITLLRTILRFAQSIMIAYIPRTFHFTSVYYARSTTTVWKRFIDAYCTFQCKVSLAASKLSTQKINIQLRLVDNISRNQEVTLQKFIGSKHQPFVGWSLAMNDQLITNHGNMAQELLARESLSLAA